MQAYNHTTDSNRLSVLGLPTSLDHEANKNLKQTLERISANENTTHTNEESSKLVTTYCGDWLEMVAQTKHKVTVEVAGASDHLEGVSVDLFHQSSEIWDVHNATQNNVLAHISKTCERIEKKNAPYDPITTVISDPDAADVRDSADCFYDSGATSLSLLLNPRFDVVSRSGDAATDEEQDKSEGNKKGENEKSNDDDDEADDDADVVDNTDHILNLESGALNTNELSGDDRLDMFRELLDMFNWEREDNQIEFHEIMIHTVLPKIFVKEWDTDYERILRMFKIEKHKAETFIICPRRYGKTVSVAMFCAAYLYMVQDASIAIFSTSKRTSGKMMTAIYGFMRELPFYKSTSFDIKNSEQIKITVYGNERSIWSYPGTVAVSLLFLSLSLYLSVCVFFNYIPPFYFYLFPFLVLAQYMCVFHYICSRILPYVRTLLILLFSLILLILLLNSFHSQSDGAKRSRGSYS